MKKIIYILFLSFSIPLWPQGYVMNNNAAVTSCSGTFYDSGGASGNYGNNQQFTKTFHSASPGMAVRLNFSAFEVEAYTDFLYVFDGVNDTAPILGIYTGTNSPGIIQASPLNISGSITVRFISNATISNSGWIATLTCENPDNVPCQDISPYLVSSVPVADTEGIIRICEGEAVTFNGAAQFSESASGAAYEWDFENGSTATGQTVTTSFPEPGIYIVSLTVTDPEGCTTVGLNCKIYVAEKPDISFAPATDEICFGNPIDLTATVEPVFNSRICTTTPLSGATFFPELQYASPPTNKDVILNQIKVDCFTPDQVLTDTSHILNICLNLEAKYARDLSLTVISPNGQKAVLSPFGEAWYLLAPHNGFYFGYPWDGTYGGALDLPGDEPGIGNDYCFSMAAGIKIPYAPGILINSPPGIGTPLQTVPATYLPWDDLDALLGSPLNGVWTIEIENHGLNNNGYLFYWDINFDPSIIPSFTPEFVSEEWLPDPSISAVDGNTITINPTTSGEQCYTYTATDNFGCTYSETKCITVLEPMGLAEPEDLSNCGGPFDLTENNALVLDGADENAYNFQFHHSFQEAIDLANPINNPQEYMGVDGEQIFMSLEDVNSGLGCIEARSFTLHQNNVMATLTSEGNSVCQNEPYAFTLTGTNGIPPFTFTYTLDGVEDSVSTLSENFVSVPLSTATVGEHTLQIISVADANCTRPLNDFLTVTVTPLPQASITINDSDPCSTIVTLVGVGGTAPYTFSYFIDSENYTVSSGTAANIVLDLPDTITGQVTIGITSVSDVNCSSSQDDTESITISQIPSLPPVADILKCDSYVLPALSAGLYYNTEPFGSGAVLPQGTSVTTTQTIYLIAADATNPNCYTQTDFTITIIESPQEVADVTVCDSYVLPDLPDDHSYYDSFGVLLPEGSLITETQAITIQMENAPVDCNATITFTVTVHPTPVLNVPASVITCSNYTLPVLLSGNYYTQPNGQGTMLPSGTVINESQVVYAYSETGTVPNCFSEAVIHITILNAPHPSFNLPPLEACDFNNDGAAAFNLNPIVQQISTDLDNQVTISVYETYNDALNDENSITDLSIYTNINDDGSIISTLYMAVKTIDVGCSAILELQLIVHPIPLAIAPAAYELCDDGSNTTDGISTFNLTTLKEEILNGMDASLFDVAFFESENAAALGQDKVPDAASYQSSTATLWIRATNIQTACFVVLPLELIVQPLPLLGNDNTIMPFIICEQNTDGFAQFQLNAHLPQILTTEPPENYDHYTVQFFLTKPHATAASPALNNLFTNTAQGQQTIWVRVTRINTGCVTIAPFDLLVENKAIAYPVLTTNFIACDTDGNNDGLFSFDLTLVEAEVLGSQNPNLYNIAYYAEATDAQNGLNAIPNPASYHSEIPYVQQIWVRIENSNTVGGCAAFTHFFLYVETLPEPILQEGKICIDFKTGEVLNTYTLTTGLSMAQHNFTWYKDGAIIPGATGAAYEVSQAGSYTVTATTLLGNCVSAPIAPVTIGTTSPPSPIGIGYTVTDAFVGNQVITVLVEGYGEYQYSLDYGPYQNSNVFTNVSSGPHTVHVKSIADDNACNAFVLDMKDIFIVDYPKFFTPNGDGYNDTWGIDGLGTTSVSNIFIFDRFGKLVKQLRAANNSSERWDGTYDGAPVFSTDYWFTLEYMENGASKEFKAHFSLKR